MMRLISQGVFVFQRWLLWIAGGIFCLGGLLEATQQDESTAIESQLRELKAKLHQLYLKEMKDEDKSQEDMIADWSKYSQDVQHIKQRQEEEKHLREQIKSLEQRRSQLSQQQY